MRQEKEIFQYQTGNETENMYLLLFWITWISTVTYAIWNNDLIVLGSLMIFGCFK